MARIHRLREIQLQARRWLIRNDPTLWKFWEQCPLDSDFVGDVRQNIRDFGPDAMGQRIVDRHEREERSSCI